VGLVVAALAALVAAPASATLPGKPGLLAFNSDRDGDFEIFVTDGGAEPTQLTDNTFVDRKPSYSPDGSQIAFQSDRDGNFDIWVMGADGSDPRQVTSGSATDFNPVWSPDGKRIAFNSDRTGDFEIFTVRSSDGGDIRQITDVPGVDSVASYSPDGRWIAFESNRDGNAEVYLTDPGGYLDFNVTRSPESADINPAWLTDDRTIVFTSDRSGNQDIWAVEPVDGGFFPTAEPDTAVNLTNDPADDRNAAPAPNGKALTFASDRGGDFDIWTVRFETGGLSNFTSSPATESIPDWQRPLMDGACANRRTAVPAEGQFYGSPAGDRIRATAERRVIVGRDGDDCLRGNPSGGRLAGQAGADRINASRGASLSAGGPGDDLIRARDGKANDRIRCGRGNDRVIADKGDTVNPDCEDVSRK
jgi:dipeptidyl aminopeptidase/acylaminoacyl peptidase